MTPRARFTKPPIVLSALRLRWGQRLSAIVFSRYPGLAGKTVFVTGDASGIGAEIVSAFAAQGSRVGFIDLDEKASAALAGKLGGDVAFEVCDLRDIDTLRAAFDKLKGKLGPVGVQVNNAARDDRHDWRETTAEYFARMVVFLASDDAAMCTANNCMVEAGSV